MDEPYRSFVVRVHRPTSGTDAVRLDIEDLQRGGRTAMQGALAERLARLLARLVERSIRRASSP